MLVRCASLMGRVYLIPRLKDSQVHSCRHLAADESIDQESEFEIAPTCLTDERY
jgi:hypothetical protein